MTVRTFVKKPFPVEAIRFDGANIEEIRRWQYTRVKQVGHPSVWFHLLADAAAISGHIREQFKDSPDVTAIVYDYLHETWVGVKTGQWVMLGSEGEFYPCADNGTGEAPVNYEEKT